MLIPPEQVTVTEGGCWLIPGKSSVGAKGYRKMNMAAKSVVAHAAFYAVFVGPVPRGSVLHHECHNPPCVNPEHLKPMSHKRHRFIHGAEITHCPAGHAYAELGHRELTTGRQRCNICARAAKAKNKAKRVAAQHYKCRSCSWEGKRADMRPGLKCPDCNRTTGLWGPQIVKAVI